MRLKILVKLFILPILLFSALEPYAQESKLDNFASQAAQVTEFEINGLKVIVKRRASSPTVAGGLLSEAARGISTKRMRALKA